MKYILFILSLFMLASCARFKDGKSVMGEGLWVIPLISFLAGVFFIYLSYRASKSNSTQQVPGGTRDNTGNVPMTGLAKFWGGVVLVLFSIGFIIYQNSQK